MINFGLDYDNTFTEDPELWLRFIELCMARGHFVYITTARNSDNIADIEKAVPRTIELIPSDGRSKQEAVNEAGVDIDVWIDDMPELVRNAPVLLGAR